MYSFSIILASLILTTRPWTFASSNNAHKIILDNDWLSSGYIPPLLALSSDWDVLGLTSNTCNTWALQTGLHALAGLEVGNLSCIPVYKGSDYPLLRVSATFRAWEYLHGALPFAGAFGPDNATTEAAEGGDPAGGDPDRVLRGAFVEGFPNTTFAEHGRVSAAQFMVEQVRRYPGEVMIYAAGSLTNVALALRLDSTFAKNARGLVVMGGYTDGGLAGSQSADAANAYNDINLIIDPEAAKIVLTAEWPAITMVGNVANSVHGTQEFLDEVYQVRNAYTTLFHDHYGFGLPYWDELAAAVVLNPGIVLNTTSFYVDVDTSSASPSYGNIRAYYKDLAPMAQKLRKIRYPTAVNQTLLFQIMKRAMQYPPSCVGGTVVSNASSPS